MSSFLFLHLILFNSAQSLIIDSDTGNELDDLYALAYALTQDSIKIEALTACHFNNLDLLADSMWHCYPTKEINTMKISYDLNQQILKYLGNDTLPCLTGANRMIGKSWGRNDPRPSDASRKIIDLAHNVSDGQKLVVITTGALTNVCSAIIEDTSIENKIVLYMLGASYDIEKDVWNKSEFNIRNDLNAFDYLLDSDVEMHIMPINVAYHLQFERSESFSKLNNTDSLDILLKNRWDLIHAGEKRVMWDLALVQAFFHPQLAKETQVNTPPENKQRKVFVYTEINKEMMHQLFWNNYFLTKEKITKLK